MKSHAVHPQKAMRIRHAIKSVLFFYSLERASLCAYERTKTKVQISKIEVFEEKIEKRLVRMRSRDMITALEKCCRESGKIGYVVLWFMGAPITLLIVLWFFLGDNILAPG